jgi:excisionase family DNA binding protein
MSLREAAQYLGYSESNLREKVKAKLIPAHRPFGKWILVKRDLDNLLRESRQEVASASDQEAARRLAGI